MTKFAFRVAVAVLLLTMLALLGVIGWQMPEPVAQRAKQAKQQAEQAELAKAKQIAEAELFERRRKSPQFRKEVAQLALARQFPGECGAEAQFAEVSGGLCPMQLRRNIHGGSRALLRFGAADDHPRLARDDDGHGLDVGKPDHVPRLARLDHGHGYGAKAMRRKG
jgi:hypothetical protein